MPETTISAEALGAALQRRHATKKFQPGIALPPPVISALEETLILSPSSFGLQPWKFLFITNPELRQKLLPHAWNQPQITDSSVLVVLAARSTINATDIDRLISATVATRGIPAEKLAAYRAMIEGFVAGKPDEWLLAWNQRQVYIALANLMTSAALLGYDSCPIEGFDPGAFDELLGLPALGYRSTVLCAVGKRVETDPYGTMPKVRYPANELIEHYA